MAWRIHDSVVRGEIDNRVKGRVRGKLWLDGLAEPVMLELEGNACPDLAGCLLQFKNPNKTFPIRKKPKFDPLQRGRIGSLGASQKVRLFAVPEKEAFEMIDRGEKPPERTANALCLEWFSETNGRVVIESAEFELTISPPEWRLSPEEEVQRAKDVEKGWEQFSQQLNEAIAREQKNAKDPEAEWNEHDYERFMKESDARTDKYMELLDKYGHSDEAEEKIAEEMGWNREEADDGDDDLISVEEMNRICEEAANEPPPEPDPHREGIDWIRTEDGKIRHPLQHRCFESAMKVWHQCKDLGLNKADDDDLAQFIFEFQTTGVKLGGALNGIADGTGPHDPAFTVAYLKRALDHLHQAQAGLEAVAAKKGPPSAGGTLPESLVAEARRELFEVREGILRLMQEFRDRK